MFNVASGLNSAIRVERSIIVMMRSKFLTAGIAGAVVVFLTGCSQSAAQQAAMPAPNDVVATVGSTSLTLAQVDERALRQSTGRFASMNLAQALYEARRVAIEELIEEALLQGDAKARGLEPPAVIEQEITSKVAQPTDTETTRWYEENQARLQGATLDQARAGIRAYLVQERTAAIRRQYMDGLRAKVATRIMLEPPRRVIAKAARPTQGPEDAPIQMIEFSDFQCPYCERAFATVKQVLNTYGDKIHFTYRHYPLANHPRARPAAEAAQCAAEQGKFWPYHDTLFGNQSRLSDGDLKQHATQLGLDAAQFATCFDSRKYQAEIDVDIRAGDEAGVSGTPAFYINGRMLTGAQPFEEFKRIIEDELARKR
jgi:protein-disulfide isomerase